MLAAAMVPRVDRVDRAYSQNLLNLWKRLALQFQAEQLAAALSQLAERRFQPLQHLLSFHRIGRTRTEIGQRQLLDRNLAVLSMTDRLPAPAHHFEPRNL